MSIAVWNSVDKHTDLLFLIPEIHFSLGLDISDAKNNWLSGMEKLELHKFLMAIWI